MSHLVDLNASNNPPDRSTERHVALRYVLVADTNVERAALCLESIKPFHLGVLVARDGDEASRVLERFGPPLLLIIDLSLSRKDGFAVIEELRANEHARTEVIAWSAVREIREFAAHRLAGSNVRVLRGGTAPSIVRGAIERALQRSADPPHADDAPIAPTPEDVHRVMADLAEKAQQVCRTPGTAVYVRAPGTADFRATVAWTSDELIPNSPYHLPRVFGWIQETGEAVVLPDLTKQPLPGAPTATFQDVVQGLVAVPIVSATGDIIGTICVFDVKPLTVEDVDVDALKALGRSVHFERTRPAPVADDDTADPPTAGTEDLDNAASSPGPPDARGALPPSPTVPREQAASGPGADRAPLNWPTAVLDRTNGQFAGARELARTRREQRELSVVLFDISTPGGVSANEADVTDDLLETVGGTLMKAIRQADLPIRWSAKELVVVLPGLGGVQAHAVAERVRAALQAGANYRVSVSGGVAELEADDTFGGIVSRAREKVRLALERGHNRVA